MTIDYEILLRVILAGVLGALIGLERERRLKEAGLRTHFLVAIGSAIFMIVSKYAFDDILGEYIVLDPSRVAAAIPSGIGFLGAGMILVQRDSIHGLTTAAGIWATAGVGLAIGAGMYEVGIFGGLLVIIGLEFLKRIFKPIIPKTIQLAIVVADNNTIQTIIDQLSEQNVIVKDYQVNIDEGEGEATSQIIVQLQASRKWRENDFINLLRKIPQVISIKIL